MTGGEEMGMMKDDFGIEPKRKSDLEEKYKLSRLEDFINVFTPNQIMRDVLKFAGRWKAIDDIVNALISEGADFVIYGERGCGKSSLAYMLRDIATGKLDLLNYYGNLREHLEKRGLFSMGNFIGLGGKRKTFNVIWVDGYGRTFKEVVHSILTRRPEQPSFGPGLLAYIPSEPAQIEIDARIGFDKVLTAQGGYKEVHVPEKPINIKEGFELAIQEYTQHNTEELIIIVDEFETVTEKAQLAHYLKNTRAARFVLVGIAQTALELLGQHASVARQVHAIELEPMAPDEIRSIIDIGAYILRNYFVFDESATDEIVKNSHSSPYWCHYLGRALVQRAIDQEENFGLFMKERRDSPFRITEEEVDALIKSLPERADCGLYEQALQALYPADDINAKVLRSIAEQSDVIISSSKVCQQLQSKHQISLEDGMQTINDFIELPGSPFEFRHKIRDIKFFTFRDPNLRRYILMRGIGCPEPKSLFTHNAQRA